MAEKFYTILTAVGKSKLANSAVLGSKINFKTLKVGDGNGAYYEPSENQTSLVNKTWEGNINSISKDETNLNWIVIETVIPATEGGFFIREAGIFDEDGDMIAVSKISETYKPIVSEGSIKDLVIKIILQISNVDNVTLKIDPTVVIATKKDIQVLESKVISINSQIDTPIYSQRVTICKEVNKLDVDNKKQVMVDVEGKTIVNLLGNDGDCEDVSKFKTVECTIALDSNSKAFDNNSIKFTLSKSGAEQPMRLDIWNLHDKMDKNKFYCLSSYIKNNNIEHIYNVFCFGINGGASQSKNVICENNLNRFERCWSLISPKDMVDAKTIEAYIWAYGTEGEFGYIDGIMLEEITEEQYNDSNFEPSEYVSGDVSVGEVNTRVKTVGKNLFNLAQDKFELLDGSNNYLVDGTKLLINSNDSVYRTCVYQNIKVKKDTDYTIHTFRSDKNAIVHIYGGYKSLNLSSLLVVHEDSSAAIGKRYPRDVLDTTITFNSRGYDTICVYLFNSSYIESNNIYGNIAFDRLQLEEGTVGTEYEPYKETYLNIGNPLRSLSNGVKDEIKDGKLIKRVEKVVLDSELGWFYTSKKPTYKIMASDNLNLNWKIGNFTALKFNSKKLYNYNTSNKSWINNDELIDHFETSPDGRIYLSILNTDSGWGDNYIPTVDEIKAYFNGWRMFPWGKPNNVPYETIYNMPKAWTKIGETDFNSSFNTTKDINVSKSVLNDSFNYIQYRLYYQLATPKILKLNQPNLVSYPNGSLIIESDSQNWARPKISYQIVDNLKANLDEIMTKLNKEINHVNELPVASNPNLLINGDFQVWQRGIEFVDARGLYTVDRWCYGGDTNSIISKTNNGVKIKTGKVGTWTNFCQRLEDDIISRLVGKIVTITFKTKTKNNDINQLWASGLEDEKPFYHSTKMVHNETNDIFSMTFNVKKATKKTEFGIQLKSDVAGREVEIEWAKLELGSVTTPFVPRLYAEEELLCKRYYEKICDMTSGDRLNLSGYVESSTTITFPFIYKVKKRVTPIITTKGEFRLYPYGVSTTISFVETNTNQTRVVGSTSSATIGNAWGLQTIDTGGEIILDSEIY